MERTKITAKVFGPLWDIFNERVKALFIKRDDFLNHVLKTELSCLAQDMNGKRLSAKARKYISDTLAGMRLKDEGMDIRTVSLVVEKATANKLNDIVTATNMHRDAFFNRFIYLLNASDAFLKRTELPIYIQGEDFGGETSTLAVGPMKAIEEIYADPLYYLRQACMEHHETGLYLLDLGAQFRGFSCWLDDIAVPGTRENKKLLKDLGLSDAQETMQKLEH